MTDAMQLFGLTQQAPSVNKYAAIGYPRNPFRPTSSDDGDADLPFYADHIKKQLTELGAWIAEGQSGSTPQPLSLVGGIGTGKSRLLQFVQRAITAISSPQAPVVAERFVLTDTGYARASIGALLIQAIERATIKVASVPDNTLPLVWAIVTSSRFPATVQGRIGPVFARIRELQGEVRREHARLLSGWLTRSQLTEAQGRKIGLVRRIDWEGELIPVIAELMKLSRAAGVVDRLYLLLDQLEELFRPVFSELRRSRLLTDLRALVDHIDDGAPIGLILAWSPDFIANPTHLSNDVDRVFAEKYDALYSRMRRRRVELPLLSAADAPGFAKTWVDALEKSQDFNRNIQPNAEELVRVCWTALRQQRMLFPGEKVTPRDLLTVLADEVDRRANV